LSDHYKSPDLGERDLAEPYHCVPCSVAFPARRLRPEYHEDPPGDEELVWFLLDHVFCVGEQLLVGGGGCKNDTCLGLVWGVPGSKSVSPGVPSIRATGCRGRYALSGPLDVCV
jgi:hypothetical protein